MTSSCWENKYILVDLDHFFEGWGRESLFVITTLTYLTYYDVI